MDLAPKSIKATSDASKPPNIEGASPKPIPQVHTRPPRPLSAGQITPGQQTIIKQVNLTNRQNAPIHSTTSYHVPRGAAAVANIAAPRATTLATPIGRATSTFQASSNFVPTGLRAIGPRASVTTTPAGGVLTTNLSGPWAQSTSRPGQVTVAGRPLTLQPATKPQIIQPITQTKSITLNQGQAQLQNLPKATAVTTVRPVNAPIVRPCSNPSATVGSLVTKTSVPVSNVNIGVPNVVSSSGGGPVNTVQATQLTRLTVTTGTPLVSLQQVGLPIKAATGTSTITGVPGTSGAAAAGLKTVPIKSLPIKAISQLPSSTARALQHAIGPKVIAQPTHGQIQLTQIPVNKVGGQMLLSPAPRGTVPLTAAASSVNANKAPVNFPISTAEQQPSPVSTSVYIQPRASPVVTLIAPSGQSSTTFATVPSYLYETSAATASYQVGTAGSLVTRPFPATTTLAPSVVATPAPIRPVQGPTTTHQVHGLVTAAFNPVMVVDSSRGAAVPLPQYVAEVLEKQLSSGTLVQADAASVAVAATAAVQTQTLVQTTGPPQQLAPTPVTTTPASPASSNSLQTSVAAKLNASPRPSILRKRDNEGSPLKAQKNLSNIFSVYAATTPSPQSPPSPPRRPDSRGGIGGNGNGGNGGHSSAGSTTISATSSPGLGDSIVCEDSLPHPIVKNIDNLPLAEMSPRKKPRKQQFANEINETKFSDEEMEFISEEKIKKDTKEEADHSNSSLHSSNLALTGAKQSFNSSSTNIPSSNQEPVANPPVRRKNPQLYTFPKLGWKTRHNHFIRYTDVRHKDERRPTVTDLANQKNIIQRLNGWKVYHITSQMTDMLNVETQVNKRLTNLLKIIEKRSSKELDKDINRVNELLKGNNQRSKVLKDQINEASSQLVKILEHKKSVGDIINRVSNKRQMKKRERI